MVRNEKINQNFLTPEELHIIFQQVSLKTRVKISGYIWKKSVSKA